ncbi:acyl-CoA dehydrogenase family protein [Aeromicrobium yanjiei]|uniref:Acyl-CoA dehydrogenase n=1 Tax=Aeromicrobium yanjiei TaxID=2662028 RepID=A0A5Q2MCN6_9ACTN|nr:acyl-CoA dehydrogenase family protein [Aeromicrobium yanjiei]QGG40328.1 acyl-CoA dehydrogenase [Aeromicrobium yanjiei]
MTTEPVGRLDADDARSLRDLTSNICDDVLAEALTVPAPALPFVPALWDALEDAGLLRMGLSDEPDADGGGWEAAAIVLAEAARSGAPGPLMETSFISEWLLNRARVRPVDRGPLTTARAAFSNAPGGGVHVNAARVPWARISQHTVVLGSLDGHTVVAVLDPSEKYVVEHANAAFQPRETVTAVITVADVHEVDASTTDEWLLRGALGRAIQTRGALARAVEMSIDHVRQRRQFGRTLTAFQAVQQLLAAAASELAVATSAVDVAVSQIASGDFTSRPAVLAISAAKSQTSRAATTVVRNCHQLHGAIGMTLDHPLRHFTMPALAWRNEFGNQNLWDDRIGRLAADSGRSAWDLLTEKTR